MDKKISQVKPADARIVQAVRKLKSSKIVDQSIEVRKNQEDIKQSQNKSISINNTISQQKTKKALTPITQQNKNNTNDNIINISNSNSNINNNIINNQNKNNINIVKRDISKSSSKNKISIDGSIIKPNTSSTSTNKTVSKTFDYETLKKYKKRQKSDYQKNLLSKKILINIKKNV